MPKQKIVFFDIDGTLIPEGTNQIPESALRAIRQGQENGHVMFVNTGRCLANIDDYVKNIGFDGMVMACGSYITYHGKVLLNHQNTDEICQYIVNAATKCNMDIVCEAYHGIYYEKEWLTHNDAIKLTDMLREYYPVKEVENLQLINFDKFITWTKPESDLPGFIQAAAPYFDYIERGGDFSEFVPKGFSKATGIDYVLHHLGLTLSDAIAIGDSNNDLPMLEHVPHSVAMGNSMPESLKEKVEYVTGDILEDGIWEALRHYKIV